MIGLTLTYMICMVVMLFVGIRVLNDIITLDFVRNTWYLLISGILIVVFAFGSGIYISVDYVRRVGEL